MIIIHNNYAPPDQVSTEAPDPILCIYCKKSYEPNEDIFPYRYKKPVNGKIIIEDVCNNCFGPDTAEAEKCEYDDHR
jgi:hypothetical protein